MNQQPSHEVGSDSARRRLIRGAMSAPAVLSLYSGGALAAGSNSCIQALSTISSPAPSATPDTWVRVRVYQNKMTENGIESVHNWVSGTDVVALRAGKGSVSTFIGSGQWLRLTDMQVYGATPNPAPFALNEYVAIRIDTTSGNIVGLIGYGSGGAAVPGTCWTSFLAKP